MQRRIHRFLATAGAVAIAVSLVACNSANSSGSGSQNAAGETTYKVRSSEPTLTTAALLTMYAKGLDKANGLNLDVTAAGTSSTLTIEALVKGAADFGTPGTATALQAIREGAKIKIIGAVVNATQVVVLSNKAIAASGVSPTAPPLDRIKALKGMTIVTGAVGSTHYQMLRDYLKQAGLNPDKDVKIVGLAASTGMINGMKQGRYDAIAYAGGVSEVAVVQGSGKVWLSGPKGEIPGSENQTAAVIVGRSSVVDAHPQDVEKLRKALSEASTAINDDHQATGEMLRAKYFSALDPAVWDLAWSGTGNGTYPKTIDFTKDMYDYWTRIDPKGASSYANVDYAKVTYEPAQG